MAFLMAQYAVLTMFVLIIISYLGSAFWTPLRKIPGPILARFSGLYRLNLVHKGNAPQNYRFLHEEYGPIVRVGPNHVSISEVAMIPKIYGIGSQFTKTEFYSTMSPHYQDAPMESVFTARDVSYHKALKSQVAHLFSMTNMRNYEPHVDECNAIFISAMEEMARDNRIVDLAIWLQWYAFDVIGNITFQRRFGFMERREDVDEMIKGIDDGLGYVKIIGQFPGLHPWIMGSKFAMFIIAQLTELRDTMGKFMKVAPQDHSIFRLLTRVKITENEIKTYDSDDRQYERTDFLAQIRSKKEKTGTITHRDEMNHLSNNLYFFLELPTASSCNVDNDPRLAGSDTTAISLRACFYYLIKTPRAYEKLLHEIDEAENRGDLSSSITYEESLRLPYLEAVIKEAMRMHPGVGFPLERYAPKGGAYLCDFLVPAGTNVSMSAPVVQQDQSIFGTDADTFRPERWLDASPEQLKNMDKAMLAFGHGTRTCIGKNISLMEMGKVIPQMLRHFHIEWASSDPQWKTHAAWFWKQSDMFVRFHLRKTINTSIKETSSPS